MRELQGTSSGVHVLPDSAQVNDVKETECRDGSSGGGKACYNAEASVDVFLNGPDAVDTAPQVAAQTEEALEEAVANGEMQKELSAIDPSWQVTTMYTPTAMPSIMPTHAPTVSAAPSQAPTPPKKEIGRAHV